MDDLYVVIDERGPAIQLADGALFHILNPDPSLLQPYVIAHSLGQLCRFTGHTRVFYSVAQHCVMVSEIVPRDLAIAGLMHDASEAFIGDISKPFKVVLEELAPGVVRGIENRIHEAIAERFGFDFPHDPLIKTADNIALATEKRDLMESNLEPWQFELPEPLPEIIHPLSPAEAQRVFLQRFTELNGRWR